MDSLLLLLLLGCYFTDVLCGRGSAANNHIGNIRFREFVNEYQTVYRSACKADKPIIALQIVLKLKSLSPPGRFLMKPSTSSSSNTFGSNHHQETGTDFWIEISEEQATRKVAQRLREKKISLAETKRRLRYEESQRLKKQQQQQQQEKQEKEQEASISGTTDDVKPNSSVLTSRNENDDEPSRVETQRFWWSTHLRRLPPLCHCPTRDYPEPTRWDRQSRNFYVANAR